MRVVAGFLGLGLAYAMALAPAFADAKASDKNGIADAFAASSAYDGNWVGDIPPQPKCQISSTMTLMIVGGTITGEVHNPETTAVISGTVAANGNANFVVNETFPGTMKFAGDHFEAAWFNGGCDRHASGRRQPASASSAVIVATRKQVQKQFVDLVQRAEAGDKSVDYTALRNAYVYTDNWDYFGSKTMYLLPQAQAAKKSGDCEAALRLVADAIRIDFTIAQAHALRSDCLQERDKAKARIEAAIADGLSKSLMASGDGDSTKTAYVVSSQREEMDILANQQVDMVTRQPRWLTNGHYYDVVVGYRPRVEVRDERGLSFGGGGFSKKTVIFDVSRFAIGRESKAAATTP